MAGQGFVLGRSKALLSVLFPAVRSVRSEQSQAGYVERAGQKIRS